MRRQSGLSLIEILVTLSILSTVIAATYAFLATTSGVVSRNIARSALDDRARDVVHRIGDEIRRAHRASLIVVSGTVADSVSLRLPVGFDVEAIWADPVTYHREADPIGPRDRIVRTIGGLEEVVCRGVEAFEIEVMGDRVSIRMTLGSGEAQHARTSTYETEVTIRNG